MEILYDVFLICKIYPRRVFWCIFIFIAAIWTTGVSIKEEKSDEEEKTEQVRRKRAGGWCEPVGALRYTGLGAFRLNRAGRRRHVTARPFGGKALSAAG